MQADFVGLVRKHRLGVICYSRSCLILYYEAETDAELANSTLPVLWMVPTLNA